MANKIKYNLKNVHVAKMLTNDGESVTYDTPWAIPGAVSLSMEPQGEIAKFFADGVVYWQGAANNGYEGDLEMALFPERFYTDLLGDEVDSSGIRYENAEAKPAPFALMFEFDGDENAIRHCLYNCTATRPTLEGETKEEAIEPKTETCTIAASPLPDGNVKASTGPTTDSAKYQSWYASVPVRSA